jgi:hypothetical protein
MAAWRKYKRGRNLAFDTDVLHLSTRGADSHASFRNGGHRSHGQNAPKHETIQNPGQYDNAMSNYGSENVSQAEGESWFERESNANKGR